LAALDYVKAVRFDDISFWPMFCLGFALILAAFLMVRPQHATI